MKPRVALSLAAFLASALAVPAEALVFDLNYNFGAVNAGGDVVVTIVDASGSAPVPLQVRNAMGNITANVPSTYRFGARYVALGGKPSPGTVSSAMIFTLDYQ